MGFMLAATIAIILIGGKISVLAYSVDSSLI